MLHEPAAQEQQQQQQQPVTKYIATFTPNSNIYKQHVANSNTILPQLSNQPIIIEENLVATSQQHVDNNTAAAATMLLVVGQRKIGGVTYLKPKSNSSLLALAVQPNVAQENVAARCLLKQQDALTTLSEANNNDNSIVTATFEANLGCLQKFSANAAGKMLLVHNNSNNNNKNNNNNNNTINNNNNNDDQVEHVPQYAEPDPAKITIDFNRRRRRGRLRCEEQMQNEDAKNIKTTIITTASPPTTQTTTNAATAAMSAFPFITTTETQATVMPIYTTTTTIKITTTTTPEQTIITTTTPLKSPSSAYLSTLFSILLLYFASASMKFYFAAAASIRKMTTFCRKLAILALQLLHIAADLKCYVNTITTLVLSSTTTATVRAKSAAAAVANSSTVDKQTALAAASTTSAATFAVANNKHIHHRYRNTLLAAAVSAQQRIASHSSGGNNCCCYKQLIYVFLLFTNILPRHSYNLYAEAAKPKSATQSHQHQQHQQQQQQQSNTQLQPYDIGNNGVLSQPDTYQDVSSQTSMEDDAEQLYPSLQSEEQLFDMDEDENEAYETPTNATHYANTTVIKTPLFPKDLFSKQQLEDGWVFCHILGVIYMFVALAIVCDEFFVPSLDVIIEKLDITDDVAGATFMAAGGSAPELFTSVIGVFVSFDDVGIGTIVGSAVFNILFVIGMCALFSKTVLTLTWWPLFRDCTFYSISLIVLIIFFRDNKIYWYEALVLFSIYIAYVVFMKWNVEVERFVKKLITRNQGNAANSSETSMATQPGGSVTSRAASETRSGPAGGSTSGATGNSSGATASSTQTGAKFRHGLLQLMIHTIDPLHDDDVPGKVDEKATQLHAIASLKVLLDATKPQRGGATTSAANHVKINLKETTLADRPNGNIDTTLDSPSLSGRRPSWIEQRVKIQTRKFSIKQTNDIEDEPEPLSMAWPDTARKRLTYILVAPLLIPMWLTLPDTRSPRGKKFYAVTFCGSIMWIAAFSYLMVWWANVAGETAKIPPEVMGLTFLAAGTSIPDLITSVIVARKGYGDMAVSSSVGSNIFDVTVGLPIPWLLYGLIYGAPVEVNSVGMVCSITILFMMLLFVVMSIACFRWRMNKGLGFTMFLLYFVFVAVSLMFEYDVIRCPV